MALSKQDIKELTTEELTQKIDDEKLRYKKLKFNHAVSSLEDPNTLRFLRKDIARLKTELRSRELETTITNDNSAE